MDQLRQNMQFLHDATKNEYDEISPKSLFYIEVLHILYGIEHSYLAKAISKFHLVLIEKKTQKSFDRKQFYTKIILRIHSTYSFFATT